MHRSSMASFLAAYISQGGGASAGGYIPAGGALPPASRRVHGRLHRRACGGAGAGGSAASFWAVGPKQQLAVPYSGYLLPSASAAGGGQGAPRVLRHAHCWPYWRAAGCGAGLGSGRPSLHQVPAVPAGQAVSGSWLLENKPSGSWFSRCVHAESTQALIVCLHALWPARACR